MPDPLVVRRVLGDRPFAGIGEPAVAAADPRLGCVVVGGDMGRSPWPQSGRPPIDRWPQYRVGVYDAEDLRRRHVHDCRRPVNSVAFRSGEVVALDARTGRPRRRHRLRVDGQVVVPLSLTSAGAGRLLVGTVDGRVLDCAATAPASPAVTSAGG
ncbi:hypothetical protein [Streptomyces sp. NPDC001070]